MGAQRILIAARGLLSRCGTWVYCSMACGILVPGPGIKPVWGSLRGRATRPLPFPFFVCLNSDRGFARWEESAPREVRESGQLGEAERKLGAAWRRLRGSSACPLPSRACLLGPGSCAQTGGRLGLVSVLNTRGLWGWETGEGIQLQNGQEERVREPAEMNLILKDDSSAGRFSGLF